MAGAAEVDDVLGFVPASTASGLDMVTVRGKEATPWTLASIEVRCHHQSSST